MTDTFGSLAPSDWQTGVDEAKRLQQAQTPATPPDRTAALLMAAMAQAGDTIRHEAPAVGNVIKGKSAEYGAWLAARSGLLGGAAAHIADPLAWGVTALSAPIWSSTELNKGEKPFYKFDPKSEKYIPAR